MATEMVLVPRVRYEKMLKDEGVRSSDNVKSSSMDDTLTIESERGEAIQNIVDGKQADADRPTSGEVIKDGDGSKKELNIPNGIDNKDMTASPMDIVNQFQQKYQLYAKRLLAYIKKMVPVPSPGTM